MCKLFIQDMRNVPRRVFRSHHVGWFCEGMNYSSDEKGEGGRGMEGGLQTPQASHEQHLSKALQAQKT